MGMFDGIVDSIGNAVSGIGLKDIASPLIGAVGSFIGTNSANNANQALMQQGNAFNAAQTDKQMEFQKSMRETQYQTAVKDLAAAGLNPMLAYSQGGAGTPAGAAATSVSPPHVQNAMSNAVSSALTAAQAQSQLKQNKLTEAQTSVADSQADNLDSQTAINREMPFKIRQEIRNLENQFLLLRAQTRVANASAALDEVIKPKYAAEGDYYHTFGWGPYALKDIGSAAGSAAQVFGAIRGTRLPPNVSESSQTVHGKNSSTTTSSRRYSR